MAPSWGLSATRTPKEKIQKKRTSNFVVKPTFQERICTIFCRNMNTWFPHTPETPSSLKRPKNFNLLFAFFQIYLLSYIFGATTDDDGRRRTDGTDGQRTTTTTGRTTDGRRTGQRTTTTTERTTDDDDGRRTSTTDGRHFLMFFMLFLLFPYIS